MKYEVGYIFKLDENYTKISEFCNNNGLIINEITPINNERCFKIEEKPKLNNNQLLQEEIYNLKQWFNTYYTEHEQKYRRLNTLKQLTDELEDPYNKLVELYQEAEIKRKRIQEIEVLLKC